MRELVARVRQLIEGALLARELVRHALEARAHEAEGQKIDPGLVEQERGDPERRAELADQWQVVPRPHEGAEGDRIATTMKAPSLPRATEQARAVAKNHATRRPRGERAEPRRPGPL